MTVPLGTISRSSLPEPAAMCTLAWLVGTVATVAWSGGMTWLLLKVTALCCDLRVTAEEENEGLDLVLHEERGYNITS